MTEGQIKDELRCIESDAHYALANFAVDHDCEMLAFRLVRLAKACKGLHGEVVTLEALGGCRG